MWTLVRGAGLLGGPGHDWRQQRLSEFVEHAALRGVEVLLLYSTVDEFVAREGKATAKALPPALAGQSASLVEKAWGSLAALVRTSATVSL